MSRVRYRDDHLAVVGQYLLHGSQREPRIVQMLKYVRDDHRLELTVLTHSRRPVAAVQITGEDLVAEGRELLDSARIVFHRRNATPVHCLENAGDRSGTGAHIEVPLVATRQTHDSGGSGTSGEIHDVFVLVPFPVDFIDQISELARVGAVRKIATRDQPTRSANFDLYVRGARGNWQPEF